ncbi:MAG: hypothetical protein WDN28_33360 [Chthoniobacter sp.]
MDTTPEARVIGTTKIIADKNANAIIVIGGEDVKAKVFRLLDQLDQRIPQVMLHTTIGELDLDDKHQFGVDYILRSSGPRAQPHSAQHRDRRHRNHRADTSTTGAASGTMTNGTGAATTASGTSTNLVSFNGNQPVLNPGNLLTQGLPRAVAAVGGSGLTGYFTAGNSMTAIVTALENTSRFRVVFAAHRHRSQQQEGDHRLRPGNCRAHGHPERAEFRQQQQRDRQQFERAVQTCGAPVGNGAADQFRARSVPRYPAKDR